MKVMPRALLSVTDKTGLTDFAKGLVSLGFELVSTGGTAKTLRDSGLSVLDVSQVTGFPEMLDGRVKTLHPFVHAGILADRRLPEHVAALKEIDVEPIDLVVVNLYAFEQTVAKNPSLDEAIESIDIGGPTMVRAAAKNHASVLILVDPADYSDALLNLRDGSTDAYRLQMAAKAFRHTAFYDSMVSRYLTSMVEKNPFTETMTFGYRKDFELRYGENSHQAASLYRDPFGQPGIANSKQIWGKELSYNNILDADAAWELVNDLPAGACAIIKHGNPCGAAVGSDFAESYRIAKASDPISAFGGIAAFNGVVDLAAAEAMTDKNNFLEVVIGTSFTPEAKAVFENKPKWGQNVRLVEAQVPPTAKGLGIRSVRGGVLIQETDEDPGTKWTAATSKAPTSEQLEALKFAWAIIPHVKSNAIVVANSNRLLGVGAGQMNRVQSVRLALEQAGDLAKGAVLASDAFFPFPDSIETAAAAGIAAVIQPGGSVKDDEVTAKANELGVPMIFSGVRHFRH